MSLKKGKFQHHQSKSLWNYTLSPGWREEEVKILKSALQLFGIGKWKKILESSCLPGKSIGQIYMQTQRLLGQQSLGDFMGLQIDLEAVFNDNMQKQDVLRKNNCIINTGDNPTKEERKRRIAQNKQHYGLSDKQLKEIRLPKVKKYAPEYMTLEDIENEKFTNLEILTHLYNLRAEIVSRISGIDEAGLKAIGNTGKEEHNQNSNSSSSMETKLTLEKSGVKKFKVISVEETPVLQVTPAKSNGKNGTTKKNGNSSTTTVIASATKNGKSTTVGAAKNGTKAKTNGNGNNLKKKNAKKIDSDEEEVEQEIESEASSSQADSDDIEEEEDDGEEEVEFQVKKTNGKHKKQEEVVEEDEDDDEDDNLVNEEEIFEDGDEEDEVESSDDYDEEDDD